MFHYLQTLGSDASDQDVKKLQAMHYEVDQYTGDDYLCGSRTNDWLLH